KMCTGFLKVMMFIFNGAIFVKLLKSKPGPFWVLRFTDLIKKVISLHDGLLFASHSQVDELFEELEDDVKTAIQSKYGNPNDMTTLWDTFRCCGYKNYTDFDGSPFNQLKGEYPGPCCGTPDGKCSLTEDIPGCFTKLVTVLEDNSFIIAGVAFGIAAIEIAAMVVSMVLYCNAGKKS
uniref:Tetraspanin 34a n=1 Tax=Cyprinodon variegatus TaxID=28743 RepID=A0A3Q2E5X2_CYPVA